MTKQKNTKNASPNLFVEGFFDPATHTITYLVADLETQKAALIDPVLDYDHGSGTVDIRSVDKVLQRAKSLGFDIVWSLETHAHADHLSGSPYVKAKTGAKIGIGEHITKVQTIFRPLFNATDLKTDGSDFDHLFSTDEEFQIGNLCVTALYTPGHTPADVTYLVADAAFVGDTMFMPDYGTARADFPGGDAGQLYRSIHQILELPDQTRLFMCHDYKAEGRDEYKWETTVLEAKKNVHLQDGVTQEQFVAMREQRDAGLAAPKLLLPSIQVNIRAGNFPEAEHNGVHYLLVPVKSKIPDFSLS